jgi:hypothetical protein
VVEAFVEDLRAAAAASPEPAPQKATRARALLRAAAEHLLSEGVRARGEVNAEYRARTHAMEAVLAERQHRLEAYAERQRQVVPPAADRFIVAGRVTDRATGRGLPHVRVRATDLDRREHDLLGYVRTDALGYFRLEYGAGDIAESDHVPETFIEVLDDEGNVVHTSARSFVEKSGGAAFIPAEVDGAALPQNVRMAQKVAATVDRRHRDFEVRRRVLERSPELAVDLGGRAVTGGKGGEGDQVVEGPVEGAPEVTLTEVKGIGAAFSDRLTESGLTTVARLARARVEKVAEILNVSEERAKAMIGDARERMKRR